MLLGNQLLALFSNADHICKSWHPSCQGIKAIYLVHEINLWHNKSTNSLECSAWQTKSSRNLLFSFSVFQEIIKSKITNIKNLLLAIKVTRLGKPFFWALKLSRKSDQIIKIENWRHTWWIISRMHWWEIHSQLVSLKKILQCVWVSSYIDVLNFKLYVDL